MFMGFSNSNKTHRNNKENQNFPHPPTLEHNIVLTVEIKEKE
jgi:hypothetical protein